MKCQLCDKEISSFHKTIDEKYFCDIICSEKYYTNTIKLLTVSEKNWHDEWFKSREIIGRLSLDLLKINFPGYYK